MGLSKKYQLKRITKNYKYAKVICYISREHFTLILIKWILMGLSKMKVFYD